MVLDGVMVLVACIALTAMHPGLAFGKDNWKRSGFSFRSTKHDKEDHATLENPVYGEKAASRVSETQTGGYEIR